MKTCSIDKKRKKESPNHRRLTSDLRKSMDKQYSPVVTS